MDVTELVVKARPAAVATDDRDRIVAANQRFLDLVGWTKQRLPTGELLFDLLLVRDVFGNQLAPQPLAILEMLTRGEAPHPFEVELALPDARRRRVAVSPIVVLDAGGGYQIVYLLEPILRRRRADEVIDRLLAVGEAGAGAGLPDGWNRRQSPEVELTRRQLDILRRLARGESVTAIAGTLGISRHTARSHVQAIYERLGVHSRAGAVAWALRHQVV